VPTTRDPSHDLLFGLLALQTGLVNQAQLMAAFHAWTQASDRPMSQILAEQGALQTPCLTLLEGLVLEHLRRHGSDPQRSLAAIGLGRSTRECLARIGNAELEASLAQVGSGATEPDADPDRTASYSVGTATSDGLRFRVLRPHARGGLGAIFVALDTELHREVALKQILDDHADDQDSRRRFLVEAEITGGLEHPGIVPVYGLGTYGDGRPYYAMLFIRGDSLKEAIERFHADAVFRKDPGKRSLELRKLLRRFTDVCNAIDYAHSRGVLHRDLKPGNVVVGKHGETLVVDWGLAKATGRSDPGSGERTLRPASSTSGSGETLPGSALGTPAYMSPEQAEGDLQHLGPRSDVYSLGATLYCLLTSRPPLAGDAVEVIPRVQRGDFPPPRALDPTLDRALEAVCLKAMAHRPADRYASPKALAEDIERWMADEPVSAWREPLSRRARRWANRNRTAVASAAVALIAGVVGLAAVLAVQTRAKAAVTWALARETGANQALAAAYAELTRAKAAVQARYELATEAIQTFHTGVSKDFLLQQEQFKALRDQLLKSAADFYGKLSTLLGKETDPASRRALAASNFALAALTGQVGRKEDALAAHCAVLAAREALAAETGADAAAKVDVGQSLTAVAYLLESTGKTAEALAAHRRAESLLAGLAGSDPAARAALAGCRARLGYLLGNTGALEAARAAHVAALADRRALAADRPDNIKAAVDLAGSLDVFGHFKEQTGRTAEALASFQEGRAAMERAAKAEPRVISHQDLLAHLMVHVGTLLRETGRPTEAEAEFRRALVIQQRLAADHPAVTDFPSSLAASHFNLGIVLFQTGKPTAEAEFRRALVIREKLAADHPAVTDFPSSLAWSHHDLGWLLHDSGQRAEEEHRKSVAICEKLVADHPDVVDFRNRLAMSHHDLGWLLYYTGEPSNAEAEHRKALAIFQTLADNNPRVPGYRNDVANVDCGLSFVLRRLGRPAEARDYDERAVAAHEALVTEDPKKPDYRERLAENYLSRGLNRRALGDFAGSAADLRRALKLSDVYPQWANWHSFRSAWYHAALAGLAGQADSGVSAAEGASEAETAMTLLRKAVAGNFRSAAFRTLDVLDPLRGRDDFRLLMMDIAFPAEPFAPGR
jgi:serine/threonine-protein kinase